MTVAMTVVTRVKRVNDGTKSRTRKKILVNKTHRFVGSPRLRDSFE
jgi:hypothetical protein